MSLITDWTREAIVWADKHEDGEVVDTGQAQSRGGLAGHEEDYGYNVPATMCRVRGRYGGPVGEFERGLGRRRGRGRAREMNFKGETSAGALQIGREPTTLRLCVLGYCSACTRSRFDSLLDELVHP